ncbi:MAG TPA: YbdK family carboxylate-amine ligase [Burkholderiales bacterium]|nr:YbdK family carboxylate-amine ligase [Burkholderiales bacterium]
MPFKSSQPLTIGVELELQILSRVDCDLTRGARELLALIERHGHPGDVKPEITESMIEVSTGIHERHGALLAELRGIRDAVVTAADRLNLLIAGGGAHPFQHWRERQIFDRPRFKQISELYGYLAKQFTIFGQHVHIGCAEGDGALYLLHALSRYIPHFIALAASSPYFQGVDTAFDSARLNSVFAFPLSGRAPLVERWEGFAAYFEKMRGYGIVGSMKDFYWDIRPKPEYGTIEIRVFDTPLTVEKAAALAAYAQTLSRYLLIERPAALSEDMYHVYNYNRFQACRFGLEGNLIDPATQTHRAIRDDVLETAAALAVHARELESDAAIAQIEAWARDGSNDARWMRECYAANESFEDLVWQQSRLWSGRD